MAGAKFAALLSMVLLLCFLVAVREASPDSPPPPGGLDSSGQPFCPKKYRHHVKEGETCEKLRVTHKIPHKKFYQMNAKGSCGAALAVGDIVCLKP